MSAGYFGSYGYYNRSYGCDTPTTLAESVTQALSKLDPPIDALILTGDYVAHDVMDFSQFWDVFISYANSFRSGRIM